MDGASLKELYALPDAFASAMLAGRTPLHWAAANGHLNICETLLDSESSVDAKDGAGDTPFHLAACHGRTKCAMMLATRGADTRESNSFGWNAIHHAAWHGHTETVGDLIESLSLRELLETPDQAGHRPIHLAVLRGHAKVVLRMLSLGGCVSPAGPCGYTPLHYACRQGSADIWKILVDHGADQYAVDEDGFVAADFSPQTDFITGELEAEPEQAPGAGRVYLHGRGDATAMPRAFTDAAPMVATATGAASMYLSLPAWQPPLPQLLHATRPAPAWHTQVP